MASTLYNNGPGPDYPGEEKEGEILPESSRKATMENIDKTHTHTHIHTHFPQPWSLGQLPLPALQPPQVGPKDTSVPKPYINCLPFLLLTPTALGLPHHCLVMVRVSLPQLWRTGDDCHHPNLGTQVLQGKVWPRQHRLCPAGGSSCQYQPSGGQGPPPAPSQPVKRKTQTVPGLRGLPDAQPVPQCSFTGTQLIHMCQCLSLTPQTHFLCHSWGINKSLTQFLPLCC